MSPLLRIITVIMSPLLRVITVIMSPLLHIITRSIIRNNGLIITYYGPEQLADVDSAEAWILKSDRQVSYGESQGVTLSSDESNHAECKTNTHSM